MRDIAYEEVEHWSFASHVVRPLRYLDESEDVREGRRAGLPLWIPALPDALVIS